MRFKQAGDGPVTVTDENGVTTTYPSAQAADKAVPSGVKVEFLRGGFFIKEQKKPSTRGKKAKEE